jgi:hypothetical protein
MAHLKFVSAEHPDEIPAFLKRHTDGMPLRNFRRRKDKKQWGGEYLYRSQTKTDHQVNNFHVNRICR